MGAFQEKAVKAIKQLADDLKVDADFEFKFANYGFVYFRKGFVTLGCLQFTFDSQNSFAFAKGKRQAQFFGDKDMIWVIQDRDAEEFLDVINYIWRALK